MSHFLEDEAQGRRNFSPLGFDIDAIIFEAVE